jgi:hypothetical protein
MDYINEDEYYSDNNDFKEEIITNNYYYYSEFIDNFLKFLELYYYDDFNDEFYSLKNFLKSFINLSFINQFNKNKFYSFDDFYNEIIKNNEYQKIKNMYDLYYEKHNIKENVEELIDIIKNNKINITIINNNNIDYYYNLFSNYFTIKPIKYMNSKLQLFLFLKNINIDYYDLENITNNICFISNYLEKIYNFFKKTGENKKIKKTSYLKNKAFKIILKNNYDIDKSFNEFIMNNYNKIF